MVMMMFLLLRNQLHKLYAPSTWTTLAWLTAEATVSYKSKFQECLSWPCSHDSKTFVPLFACSKETFEYKINVNYKVNKNIYFQVFDMIYPEGKDSKKKKKKIISKFGKALRFKQFSCLKLALLICANGGQWNPKIQLKYSLNIVLVTEACRCAHIHTHA